MIKALITGINGFVGTHLNNLLLEKGYEVYGIIKPDINAEHKANLYPVDILDFDELTKTIEKISPDCIFHLAALTSPAESFKNPMETVGNNIGGQVNILEALKNLKMLTTKVLVVSSAEVYGAVNEKDLPIDENTKLRPTSPYAVSKIAQDFLGFSYFYSQNIKTIRVRPFNHIGPNQSPFFAIPAFAKQIAEIEKKGMEPVLRVGNLDAKRDFTDVRDVVRAYELLMLKGDFGEVYNIGSGRTYAISEVLDILLSFSKEKIIVEKDPQLLRPGDIPELVCNYSKIHNAIGWTPQIPIETSLKDTLDYWRNIV